MAPVPQSFLEHVLSAMTQAVAAAGPDGRIVLANPAAVRLLGKDLNRLASLVQAPIARAFAGETLVECEIPVDGMRAAADIAPVRDPEGRVAGAALILHDVSERDELRQFRRAVEQSPSSVVITNTAGDIVYVNPKFTEVTGYSYEEAVGRNPRILKSGEQPREFYEKMWQAISSGKEWRCEFLNRRKNGEEYWEDASLSPVFNAAGAITHYIAVKHEITERKRMEERLRRSNETLRMVIQASPLAIVTLDERGGVTGWNRAAELMFGWTEAEAVGGAPPMTIPEQREELTAAAVRAAREGEVARFETAYKAKDGRAVETAVWLTPLRDAAGALAVMADVGERKRLEERLRQTHSLEVVRSLAGGVAHDFNNLMTVVIGYAQLLSEELLPGDPRLEPVRAIMTASQRVSALTAELLSYSGRQMVTPMVFSPSKLIVGLERRLRQEAGPQVQVRLALDRETAAVRADPQEISQALLSLAAHAREGMPDGGTLTIETSTVDLDADAGLPPGRYARIVISDTGVPLDPEAQRRLFEPFYTTREMGRGRGLGLAAVAGVMKQAGGEIRAAGGMFEILLPAR